MELTIKDTLLRLLNCRGVTGNEHAVRNAILELVTPLADDVKVDTIGNVFAYKKGTAEDRRKVMLDAHMDEVGLIISYIRDDGLLCYEPVGGIDSRVLVSKRVLIGENAVPGIIGAKAIHLQSEEEFHAVLSHDKLLIDIGAKDKADAQSMVSIGDYASFATEPELFGDDLVCARALDDRVGCLALIKVLEGRYPCDVTCVFAVQEEIGLRGSHVATYHVQPDIGVALEGTTSNDLGDVPEARRVCSVGQGVAISFMDNSTIAHTGLLKAMIATAEKNNVRWQYKSSVAGGNDAGAMQTSAGAVATIALSAPCRNIHSPASVASLKDVEGMCALIKAFLSGPCNDIKL